MSGYMKDCPWHEVEAQDSSIQIIYRILKKSIKCNQLNSSLLENISGDFKYRYSNHLEESGINILYYQ